MNSSVKYGLLILSISYMSAILFPSMALAANDKKDKKYMCHGWHGYQNKQMDLFDQPVDAPNQKAAELSATQLIVEKVKESSDPHQKVHTHVCHESSAQ